MSDEIINVSIDDGHFNNKGQMIGKNGEIVSYISPSYIMPGSTSSFGVPSGSTDTAEFVTEAHDGQERHFTTFQRVRYGEEESMVDTQNQDYLHSEANRVMVHSMLHRMGLSGKKVSLITTAPIRRYFKTNGEIDQHYIDLRNENLQKPVHSTIEGVAPVEIVSVTQIPESYAAFLSLLFDYRANNGSGQLKIRSEYMNKDILMFDFGGQTMDLGVISNGQLMKARCITDEGVGMLSVSDRLYDELKTYRRNIDRNEMMKVIETGTFKPKKNSDNEVNVKNSVLKCIQEVYQNGIENAMRKLPLNEFDMVLGAGGPLEIKSVAEAISSLIPDINIVENSLMANANGGLKYLIKLSHKGK